MSSHPPARVHDAVLGCLEACQRCLAVIDEVESIEPSAYPAVGPHLRHCVDHFRLLLAGAASGEVEYDARAREERLERDPGAMRHALRAIGDTLADLSEDDLGRALKVTQSAAPGRAPAAFPSRLDRELVFLSSHTIHHIAIMVLAARAVGVEIPASYAVAFSTEAHRDALVAKR